MSGLLVKSTAFMKENLEIFNKEGISVPVILGGAALTPKFVHQDCQNTYKGQVVYGKDAFADLHFMDKLMPAKTAKSWDDFQGFLGEYAEENGNGLMADNGAKTNFGIEDEKLIDASEKSTEPNVIDTVRSEAVDANIARPTPPFWGTQILQSVDISLEEVFPLLDLQALFVGQWQFRKPREQSREEYDQFLADKVHPILTEWKAKVTAENLLHPTVVYGYFPCQSEGNTLFIYEPELVSQHNGKIPNGSEPIAKFEFPRQKSGRRLCIADFFASRQSGLTDVFPLQAVTVGEVATAYAKKLFEGDNYTDYLYFHGMAVQMAEALAEWTHARIRQELGFGDSDPDNIRDILQQRYQGSRYSFGYPACPNMQDQYTQLDLLQTDRIGLFMDESEQVYPEQSTTAIIAYHPTAKYFSA
jgi:5-methyltetrahydrofolate--homocysteine methyltransferase